MVYNVGQVVNNFIHHQECMKFDIDDNGATMLVFFDNPTQNEIDQFQEGENFEIRFTELDDVIMITVKIGSLNWMDAPYNINLSKNLTNITLPSEGEGLALTLIFVDARRGEIKSIRLIGLSTYFTTKLLKAALKQKANDFNKEKYDTTIHDVYTRYNTNTIAKMSNCYYRITGK